MAKVGYARVSSTGQSLEIQLDKLDAVGCDRVFKEKRSGTTDKRPQLRECLRYLREGDTLVVSRLDRLARSTLHLHQIAEQLRADKVELVVLDQAIDTSTPTGRLLFSMLGAISEFETALRSERQMDGIAKAKSRGVRFGRKASLTAEQVTELRQRRAAGALVPELMRSYGVSKATVYRALEPS